jgi:hypothetical protein
VFCFRYAMHVHDDIEWLARPVTSLSWFFSLALCHMEAARDVPHNFVLRAFWMYRPIPLAFTRSSASAPLCFLICFADTTL